jgi:hypothetical protein
LASLPVASNIAPWSSKLWETSWPMMAPMLPKFAAAGAAGS